MRFRREIKATPPQRTKRRIANAEKAVRKEREEVALFPELCRYKSAEERLKQQEEIGIRYWQEIRDESARSWRKFRRRFYSLREDERMRFLAYWNKAYLPGDAHYANDCLSHMFNREDWREEDMAEIRRIAK